MSESADRPLDLEAIKALMPPPGHWRIPHDRTIHALIAEVERLRVEHTRAILRYTVKGYTAGENADAKHWRERAEAAEHGASDRDDRAWLVELGSMPPQWWTGRRKNGHEFSADANEAMRFARREDAEGAIGHLVKDGTADGCKATEHIWLSSGSEPWESDESSESKSTTTTS